MHTSYLPTGQRSRLKEVMQISRRRRDNQFFLESEVLKRTKGGNIKKGKRDRVGKHYPIMLHIS